MIAVRCVYSIQITMGEVWWEIDYNREWVLNARSIALGINIENILLSHLSWANAGTYNRINNNCIQYAIAVLTSYTF